MDVVDKSMFYKKYEENGNLFQFELANKKGSLPVNNFSLRFDPRAFYYTSKVVKEDLEDEATKYLQHGYEIFSMLGTNLGIYNAKKVIVFYKKCLKYGLDYFSVGNILGWAFQAKDKGLLGNYKIEKTVDGICNLIQELASDTGFGILGSRGIKVASSALGDKLNGKQINGLEVGPFDYRGFPSQAISDYQELNIYQFLDFMQGGLIPGRIKMPWVCYQENISMGMDCLGLSDAYIATFFYERSIFKQMIIDLLPSFGTRFMNSYTIAYYFSAYSGIGVKSNFIEHLGNLCYCLQEKINSKIEDKSKEEFCSYFTIDPKSNFKKSSVVEFTKLFSSYKTFRNKIIL